MKFFLVTVTLLSFTLFSYSQNIYQIRADSVRIYSGCDTAELILENHTQDTLGFLYNKGKGRTEFRKLQLATVGDSAISIVNQDTLLLRNLSGYWSAKDSSIYNKNTGNVGIGINSPTERLEVNGTIKAQQIKFLMPTGTDFKTLITLGNTDTLLRVSNYSISFGIKTNNSTSYVYNTVFGNYVLGKNTTGSGNTAMGHNVLFSSTTGSGNTAMGYNVLTSNTTGYSNTGLGFGAMSSNTTGAYNIAIGDAALGNNKTSTNNIAIGRSALSFHMEGLNNIGIGGSTLYNNRTGDNNTALGSAAGSMHKGSNSIFIGWHADAIDSVNNVTVLGTFLYVKIPNIVALAGSDQNVIIGADATASFYGYDTVKNNSGDKLQVIGSAKIGGSLKLPVSKVSTDVTLGIKDHTILVNNTSNIFISLPAVAESAGIVYIIKKISNNSNTVTIVPTAGNTIDGATTYVISTYNKSIQIQSDGTAWYILTVM